MHRFNYFSDGHLINLHFQKLTRGEPGQIWSRKNRSYIIANYAMQWLAMFIRPKCPSRMLSNLVGVSKKAKGAPQPCWQVAERSRSNPSWAFIHPSLLQRYVTRSVPDVSERVCSVRYSQSCYLYSLWHRRCASNTCLQREISLVVCSLHHELFLVWTGLYEPFQH